ncbi:MAG TPA: hypothetical protein VGQ65_18685 [Thermoanaerobaculia bacterium]|jgi:hypothetical protein|nr:hypothetical protein [Thermoanaerobaculia bacterium]
MKSIFRFPLELGRVEIGEPVSIKFSTTGTIVVKNDTGEISTEDVHEFEIEIRIAPRLADASNSRERQDWLELRIARAPEKYFLFARQFASEVAVKIAFFCPEFQIRGGFAEAERVPENIEEESSVGEKRHLVLIWLRETDAPFLLNQHHLRLLPFMAGLERTIRQYTAARDGRNPIEGYLGMFKVIETLYYSGRGHIRTVLKGNNELRDILRQSYRTGFADEESLSEPDDLNIDVMIDDMIRTRDQCAHLRGHNAFGYAPGDAEVFRVVEPILAIISIVAREAIRRRIDLESGGLLPTMYGSYDRPLEPA